MSMFSGITVALREDNGGFELNMADVRMEFDESFRVLNSTAVEFDQWCEALDRLSQLNQEIEQHDGKADKALIMFLNQNNDLAEVLGVDLSLENWDEEAKGAEIRQGYSMAMEGVWESIKKFFASIYNGIVNFFKNFFNMFKGVENKAAQAAQNSAAIAQNIAAGKGPAKSKFRIASEGVSGNAVAVNIQSFKDKVAEIEAAAAVFAKATTVPLAIQNLSDFIVENGDRKGKVSHLPDNVIKLIAHSDRPWEPGSDVSFGNTVGEAFKNAGWTQDSIAGTVEDAKKLIKAGQIADKAKGVLEQILKMEEKDLQPLIEKNLALKKSDDKSMIIEQLKDFAKKYLSFTRIIGRIVADFSTLLDDINSLSAAQKAEENKIAADAKAKEEQEKKKQEQAAQLPTK